MPVQRGGGAQDLTRDRAAWWLGLRLVVVLAGGWWLPSWAQSLVILALGKGMVVLGLLLLMRCGLVSFGQGLYYCLGAYAAVSVSKIFGCQQRVGKTEDLAYRNRRVGAKAVVKTLA